PLALTVVRVAGVLAVAVLCTQRLGLGEAAVFTTIAVGNVASAGGVGGLFVLFLRRLRLPVPPPAPPGAPAPARAPWRVPSRPRRYVGRRGHAGARSRTAASWRASSPSRACTASAGATRSARPT